MSRRMISEPVRQAGRGADHRESDQAAHPGPEHLTQRCVEPACEASVTVDGSGMRPGDRAGLCALISGWAQLALCREEDGFTLRLYTRQDGDAPEGSLRISRRAEGPAQRLRLRCTFGSPVGQAQFFLRHGESWQPFEPRPALYADPSRARFGLLYVGKEAGGYADFLDFRYDLPGKADQRMYLASGKALLIGLAQEKVLRGMAVPLHSGESRSLRNAGRTPPPGA